jgi:hypothetical protein
MSEHKLEMENKGFWQLDVNQCFIHNGIFYRKEGKDLAYNLRTLYHERIDLSGLCFIPVKD